MFVAFDSSRSRSFISGGLALFGRADGLHEKTMAVLTPLLQRLLRAETEEIFWQLWRGDVGAAIKNASSRVHEYLLQTYVGTQERPPSHRVRSSRLLAQPSCNL